MEPSSDTLTPGDFDFVRVGDPPLRQLRYQLTGAIEARYWVIANVRVVEGESTSVVETWAPLSVSRTGASPRVVTLRLALGPVEARRTSASSELQSGHDDSTLNAEIDLDPRGVVREVRRQSGEASGALLGMWQSLLERDALPDRAVGVGARWRHRRALGATHSINSESELIALDDETWTFRVWRKQHTDGRPEEALQAVGEWTVSASTWPPLGIDRMNAMAAGAARRQVVSFFKIVRGEDG